MARRVDCYVLVIDRTVLQPCPRDPEKLCTSCGFVSVTVAEGHPGYCGLVPRDVCERADRVDAIAHDPPRAVTGGYHGA